MTTLGIQYLEYLEKERSNRAQERIKQDTLNETARSNRAQEYLKAQALAEEIRANQAMEKIKEDTRIDNFNVSMANTKLRFKELEHSKDKLDRELEFEGVKTLTQEGSKAVTSVIGSAVKLLDAILPL